MPVSRVKFNRKVSDSREAMQILPFSSSVYLFIYIFSLSRVVNIFSEGDGVHESGMNSL